MASFTIFYSWQMDAPVEINKSFIGDAIKEAVKGLRMEVQEADRVGAEVDQGMREVPGSPEVATIMFEKIGEAAIYIGDVSLVGKVKNGEKQIPNPNVSIEEGFAAGVLGWERVICISNQHFGTNQDQPFDQRNRRFPIDYTLKPDASPQQREEELRRLIKDIRGAVVTVQKYELRKAEKAAGRLDLQTIELLLALRNHRDEFIEPAQADANAPILALRNMDVFHRCVLILLDLRIICTNLGVDENGNSRYSYRWTTLGKKVRAFVVRKATRAASGMPADE